MSVLDALLEFDPGEMRDPMGRWVHGASSPRHGSFKIGDRVKYETGSRGAGGHGPVTFTQQPGVHEVVGFQRNGNLRLRHPDNGTTVDVHHSHATKITRLHPEYRGAMVQQDYARDREKIAREKAARARALPTSRRATLGRAEGDAAARTRAEILAKSPGAAADLARHQSIASGARERAGSEHAAAAQTLTNLPKGSAGMIGGVRVNRSERGFEVYPPGSPTPAKVHKTPSAAAGHALRLSKVLESAPTGPLGALLEGFAAEQQDPFPGQSFAMGDQVRVSVGGGARAITGKVVRPHGGPPATHAVVAPEGGGAHVLSPVGQVKLDTPAQHAAAAKRQEREEAKQQPAQAHAQWMAAKPVGSQPPGAARAMPAKAGPVREGLEVVLEAFGPAAAGETPAQSQKIGAQNVAQAQKSLASGWNASKHPRAQGGKFGYTTGGKRAKRGQKSGSRTLGVGAHGALVRSIQRQVGTAIDGKYGPQTRAAVSRYQQQHGLQVDGVVGRQTLASLRGSVNARRVAPGPISSRQATVKASRAKAPVKAKAPARARAAKPVAPVRVAGGVLVH